MLIFVRLYGGKIIFVKTTIKDLQLHLPVMHDEGLEPAGRDHSH